MDRETCNSHPQFEVTDKEKSVLGMDRETFIFLNVKYIFMKKNVYTYHMKTLG